MAKKSLLIMGMMVAISSAVLAQVGNTSTPISIGVKATLDFSSDGGVQTGPYNPVTKERAVYGTSSEFNGGLSVFFDARFVEFSTNFLVGVDTFEINKVLGVNVNYLAEANMSFSTGLSLLGKFPFSFGKLSLAPAIGTEYRLMVFRVAADFLDEAETIPNDFMTPYNTLLVKFGGIVDFDLTERLFLRGTILGSYVISAFTDGNFYTQGIGAQIQLGIGYRL